MKFGHILANLITSISNIFLAQCWGQETSSRSFTMLNIYHAQFSVIYPFKKIEHLKLDIIGSCVIGAGCYIEKSLELSPSPPNCSEDFRKLLPLFTAINRLSLVG